jgi:6-phosphogluconolactonase
MEEWVGEPAALATEVRSQLERACQEALAQRGVFHLAVPGGSLATLLFPSFAQARVEWGRVHVWWVDERAVAPTHPDSNYRGARELWLATVSAQEHRMQGELPVHQAVQAYEAELSRALGPAPLDVALLGVGPDGHVASLFPGHALLGERERRVLAVEDAPKPPPQRLTLSLPVIASAREVWVVMTGAAKAPVAREAFTQPKSQLPLARVVRAAKMVRLFLDPPAANVAQR